MAFRVAINGFGRIGRMALRAIKQEFPNLQVVGINDLLGADYLAYMLKYDSVHGHFNGAVTVQDDHLIIDEQSIRLTAERDPADLAWGDIDVDVVIESTGLFLTQAMAKAHLAAGAKKVVMSAPSKDATAMFVYGVNHHTYQNQAITSAASCTTNCLAPIAKIMDDNWGIKRGLMTTVHAATATQKTVDSPSQKDWRGGRGILENIIPSATGAAKAVGVVLPQLNGRLTGMAFRVPTSDVSVVDLTVELKTPSNYEAICNKMQTAAQSGDMSEMLAYTDEPVVSTDFRGCRFASIFDAKAGIALDDTFIKLVSWYDNEYGYTCNLLRFVQHIVT